ncbi:MAG TPA: hypothetical protein EYG86_05305 [Crocinitomicaceae bacterium]|nr:hypothetical protein [Crocinitomicaceae bacterium]
MKNIKTLILSALLISSTGVFAQKTTSDSKQLRKVENPQRLSVQPVSKVQTPERLAALETKKMSKELGLNSVQVSQIIPLNEVFQKDLATIKTSKMMNTAKVEANKRIAETRLSKFKEILTSEQFTKYTGK